MPSHPIVLGLRRFMVAAGVAVSAISLLGFLGRLHWILDLCSHFRVQYLVALVLLAGLLAALRRWKAALSFALVAGLNLIPLLPLFTGSQATAPFGPPVLRVMLLNVNTQLGDPKRVKQVIQEENPDILVLEEISEPWMAELEWLKKSHPHAITKPRADNFGIGLFSKLPLVEGEVVRIGAVNIPSILATLQTPGSPLRLVATHPTPPTSRDYARWRDQQLEQLPAFLDSPGPRLLVGDLNVTPWNPRFRRLMQRSGLRDSSRGRGFQPTWPQDLPLLRIPIDHVLHSPDILVVNKRIGREVNSDHSPVIVDFMVITNETKAADKYLKP